MTSTNKTKDEVHNDYKRSRGEDVPEENNTMKNDKKLKVENSDDNKNDKPPSLSTDILLSALEFLEKDDGSRCKCVCKDWNKSIEESSNAKQFWQKFILAVCSNYVVDHDLKGINSSQLEDFKEFWWDDLVVGWDFSGIYSDRLEKMTHKEKSQLFHVAVMVNTDYHGIYELFKNTPKHFTVTCIEQIPALIFSLLRRSGFVVWEYSEARSVFKNDGFSALGLRGTYSLETPLLQVLQNEIIARAEELGGNEPGKASAFINKFAHRVNYHCRHYKPHSYETTNPGMILDGSEQNGEAVTAPDDLDFERGIFRAFRVESMEWKLECKTKQQQVKMSARDLECETLVMDPKDPNLFVKLANLLANHQATDEQVNRFHAQSHETQQSFHALMARLCPTKNKANDGATASG